MSVHIVLYCLTVAGSAFLGSRLFDSTRAFAPWAKIALSVLTVLGIALGFVPLAWDYGWIALGEEASHRLDGLLSFGRGMALGLIFALLLSGKMFGTKKTAEPAATAQRP